MEEEEEEMFLGIGSPDEAIRAVCIELYTCGYNGRIDYT
jgi:hypothetical protein